MKRLSTMSYAVLIGRFWPSSTLVDAFRILGLARRRLAQPPTPNRVSREPRLSRDVPNREAVAEMHPPNLGQYAHGNHSALLLGDHAGSRTCGSIFDANL